MTGKKRRAPNNAEIAEMMNEEENTLTDYRYKLKMIIQYVSDSCARKNEKLNKLYKEAKEAKDQKRKK